MAPSLLPLHACQSSNFYSLTLGGLTVPLIISTNVEKLQEEKAFFTTFLNSKTIVYKYDITVPVFILWNDLLLSFLWFIPIG